MTNIDRNARYSVPVASVAHLGDVVTFDGDVWDDMAPVSWRLEGGGLYTTLAGAEQTRDEFKMGDAAIYPVVSLHERKEFGFTIEGVKATSYRTGRFGWARIDLSNFSS